MNADQLTNHFFELLERCESPIERKLLVDLYSNMEPQIAQQLQAQFKIDRYPGIMTIPDFVFPDMRIAIYCDGFAWRANNPKMFKRDRLQSRELQLQGWIVLRFAGSEINRNSAMVVDTVQRAIAQQGRQRAWRNQQQQTLVVREEEKGWQESMQEWRNEKEKTIPARLKLNLHSGQRPQKPKGGMCGVIVLASIIVGVLVLLDFIF